MFSKYLTPRGRMLFDGDGGGAGGGNSSGANAPDGQAGGYGMGGNATSGGSTSSGNSGVGGDPTGGAASGAAGATGVQPKAAPVPVQAQAANPAATSKTASEETERRRAVFRAIGVPGALADPANSLF